MGHQLPDARNLESRLLDGFAQNLEVLSSSGFDGGFHHPRTRNAHIDNRIPLGHPVKRAGHERIVIGRVAEHHELCAS